MKMKRKVEATQTAPTPAYFTYEQDFALRWMPVVYYGEKPKGAVSAVYEVGDQYLEPDGSPRFGALQARYPAPAPVQDSTS